MSEPTNVVRSLLDDVERDLAAFRRGGPNHRLAGNSAVTSLNAVIKVLREVRQTVARELMIDVPADEPLEPVTDALRMLLDERFPDGQ